MKTYLKICGIVLLLGTLVYSSYNLIYEIYAGKPDFWDIFIAVLIFLISPSIGVALIKIGTMD